MDTEAIASEIVFLKNRISELDDGSVEEKEQLLERLRSLQDQLSAKSSDSGPASKTTLQYVKPS